MMTFGTIRTIRTMTTNMISMDSLISTRTVDADFDAHLMHLHLLPVYMIPD